MTNPGRNIFQSLECLAAGITLTAPCVAVTFYYEHAPAPAIADFANRALEALDPHLTHYTAGSMPRPARRNAAAERKWNALFAAPRVGSPVWMRLDASGPNEGCSAASLEVSYRALRPPPATQSEVAARIAQNADLFEVGRASGTLPLSFVRATFPLTHEYARPDTLLAFVRSLACVQSPCFVAGHAGYALNAATEIGSDVSRRLMQTALGDALSRHPGLDWEYSGAVSPKLLRYWPGHAEFIPRFKRVNWLTFVRCLAIEELCGGRDAVLASAQAYPDVQVHDLPDALMFQAGSEPAIGGAGSGDDLPAYRAIAKALAPARLPSHAGIGNIFTDAQAQAWLTSLEREVD